jgi:hypothetical protein
VYPFNMAATPDGLFFFRPHEVDIRQWEACLARTREALLYAHAWYLNAVCPRWSAVVERKDGRYVSLLPLPEKGVAGCRQIYQPFFTQQLGLFTTPDSRCTRPEEYLALIPGSYFRVYVQLNAHNQFTAAGPATGLQLKERRTYQLVLDQPYEKLYQGYSSNQKRNIKKSPAAYQVVPGDMSRLIALFRESKGAQVPELRERDYGRLSQLYQELNSRGLGQVLELRAAGQLLAAGLFLSSRRHIIYLFGASTALGRQQGAMAKLLDWLIRDQAGSGKVFDFEGSDMPSLAKFYANFGAQPVPYLSLSRTSIPFLPSWLNQKFLS